MINWAGAWRVSGILPDGAATYEGRIDITARGESYALRWDISDGVYFGIGAAASGRLFVSCSPFATGMNLLLTDGARVRHFADSEAASPPSWSAPAIEGFSVGAVTAGAIAAEALCYRDPEAIAAAWGRDLARHVLLVYERGADDDEVRARWTLGRTGGAGREVLRRL